MNFSVKIVIANPTRVTRSTAAIIDHIYANSIQQNLTCGIIVTDITDHFPVFCISHICDLKDPVLINVFTRKFNDRNFQRFFESLDLVDWTLFTS